MVKLIADRLSDTEEIKKAKAFPYQLLTTYLNISSDIPIKIKEALQDAMEVAVENVPSYDCNVAIFPDVSGSMSSAVTGYRKGSTSVTRCIDVAALVTSAILRRNREAIVLPFEGRVVDRLTINPRDSVMTNAKKLAGISGGSTDCSAPLQRLVEKKIYPDLCIFVSDSESWVGKHFGTGTSVAHYWSIIKLNNPKTKLVCINLTPNKTSQIKDQKDVLNIGGFSDTVFDIINLFVKDQLSADHWVGVIEQVKL
jgi:60 kDa SS-A/Ro ribonucleoprotein